MLMKQSCLTKRERVDGRRYMFSYLWHDIAFTEGKKLLVLPNILSQNPSTSVYLVYPALCPESPGRLPGSLPASRLSSVEDGWMEGWTDELMNGW